MTDTIKTPVRISTGRLCGNGRSGLWHLIVEPDGNEIIGTDSVDVAEQIAKSLNESAALRSALKELVEAVENIEMADHNPREKASRVYGAMAKAKALLGEGE